MSSRVSLLMFAVFASLALARAETAAPKPQGNQGGAQAPQQGQTLDTDALYDLGKNLFDAYASDEIKAEYEFPSREQWNAFLPRLQKALDGESTDELVALEPELRSALKFAEQWPDASEFTDWLRERLDLIEAAKQAKARPLPQPTQPQVTPTPPPQKPTPAKPAPSAKPPVVKPPAPTKTGALPIPNYDLWMARLKERPAPENAPELMPILRRSFAAEGVPADLAWIAEAESTLNPAARNPSGAKGLFQLMPDTAKGLGLSTWMPDERANPEKSARAAARLLRGLKERFGEWPLAIAAYNAGEGRVRRLLEKEKAKSFADIAGKLPVETRFYVPKVLALVSTRTGTTPERL